MDRTEALVGVGIFGTLFLLIAGTIWLIVEDGREWAHFRDAHNCRVVSKIRGDTFNTWSVGPNGQMQVGIGSTPSKTGYLCDDGITYYR